MNIVKRTEGKIKGCVAGASLYKFYRKKMKALDKTPLSTKEFSKIIKACNLEVVRNITDEAEIVRLPMRLGYMQICKYERSFNKKLNDFAVDWGTTNKIGQKVFFEQKYIYRWVWLKRNCIVVNKSKYRFEACRAAKRAVPKALRELKIEYYGRPNKY